MSSARLTIGLLVLVAALAAVVPTIRRGYARVCAPPPRLSFSELECIAERSGRPLVWLAVAEIGWEHLVERSSSPQGPEPSGHTPEYGDLISVWRQAMTAPRGEASAAAVQYALFRLHPLVNRLADSAATIGDDDRSQLALCRRMAEWAHELASKNAASDVLTAWTWFAEDDPDRALSAVEALAGAKVLTIYPGQVARAMEALGKATGSPPDTTTSRPEIGGQVWAALVSQVSRRLAEVGAQARRDGERARARGLQRGRPAGAPDPRQRP